MRIIGGRFRGTALAAVGAGDAAAHLRPTTDRVRESLFNLLQHGAYPDFEEARVLDLFAGTGALGLEALSRGAATCLFVERGVKAQAILRQNVAKLGVADGSRILKRDATCLGPNAEAPFTHVFLDPPYGQNLGAQALEAAATGGWLAPEALVIWEESAQMLPPAGFMLADARRYGETTLTILRAP